MNNCYFFQVRYPDKFPFLNMAGDRHGCSQRFCTSPKPAAGINATHSSANVDCWSGGVSEKCACSHGRFPLETGVKVPYRTAILPSKVYGVYRSDIDVVIARVYLGNNQNKEGFHAEGIRTALRKTLQELHEPAMSYQQFRSQLVEKLLQNDKTIGSVLSGRTLSGVAREVSRSLATSGWGDGHWSRDGAACTRCPHVPTMSAPLRQLPFIMKQQQMLQTAANAANAAACRAAASEDTTHHTQNPDDEHATQVACQLCGSMRSEF